ncbi:hypothetical protein PC118_g8128 [Phytophthora cactorum]|uniref:Uncharacterized protein n=3 Tax=Phytophthora cactorum TaxID=29920 RepID=A0A8T1G8H1_9STRA|nr:hypothetical protein PC118_g8128 [Phytophthora cactorum]
MYLNHDSYLGSDDTTSPTRYHRQALSTCSNYTGLRTQERRCRTSQFAIPTDYFAVCARLESRQELPRHLHFATTAYSVSP